MIREKGFYWVRFHGESQIAKWEAIGIPDGWRVCGDPGRYLDEDFDSIDERAWKQERR